MERGGGERGALPLDVCCGSGLQESSMMYVWYGGNVPEKRSHPGPSRLSARTEAE